MSWQVGSKLSRRQFGLLTPVTLGSWIASASPVFGEEMIGVGGKRLDPNNMQGSIFIGRYTDPKHPGGFRDIQLSSMKLGDFQLATVKGGGGRGEPASFELNGMVGPPVPDRSNPDAPQNKSPSITIDFSPKGGPRELI